MNQPNFLNRRQFIGQAGCAALGTTGLLSTLLNLGLATRVMAGRFQRLQGDDLPLFDGR